MDVTEVAQVATQALENSKSAQKRIDALCTEVKDIRELTVAVASVNQKVDGLDSDVKEIKTDVKAISSRPGQWWDKLIAAGIGAAGAAIAAGVLK
jgi:outer membrane murein-binding lipoprotein Lpp